MTKAERIFQATKAECIELYKTRGYIVNPDGSAVGISGLINKDTECVCIRTVNAVQACLDRALAFLNTDVKLGVLTADAARTEFEILAMVQSTINNERKRQAAFQKSLKEF